MKPVIHIVGTGFSGLAAAHYLSKAGFNVEIFERNPEAGGLIHSTLSNFGIAESAANALMNSVAIEELAAEIGLELIPAAPRSRARFLFREGLRKWPLSFRESLPLFSFLLRYIFSRKKVLPIAGENIESWGNRNLGKAANHYMLSTALQGIYAGDPKRLSASLLLKNFFPETKPARPNFRGSVAPRKGMSELIDKLVLNLKSRGVSFHFNCEYDFSQQGDAKTLICTPAYVAAKMLKGIAPELAKKLADIEMLSLASITVFYSPQTRSIPGFGCLFPRNLGFRALGVLANHEIFPHRCTNSISETWIFGGALDPNFLDLSDSEIMAEIARERTVIFPEDAKPVDFKIHRWPQAIPHYTVELERILKELPRAPKIHLFGNYVGQIGLKGILNSAKCLPEELK